MKILFIVGPLQTSLDANTRIAALLGEKMATKGHDCHVLAPARTTNMSKNKLFPLLNIHSFEVPNVLQLDCFLDSSFAAASKKKHAFLRKLLVALCHPIRSTRLLCSMFFDGEKALIKSYLRQVRVLHRKFTFNAAVVIYFPPYLLKVAAKLPKSLPLFLYQLDPWALHELDVFGISIQERQKQEMQAFKRALHIFTTTLLMQRYTQTVFNRYLYKVSALEFPVFNKPQKNVEIEPAISFSSGYCNLLFAGALSDTYRSPQFLFKLLGQSLEQNPNLRLYFMGSTSESDIAQWGCGLEQSVFFVAAQPQSTAVQTMLAADILVNIGNTMKNQLPSKINEYLGIGKPILNICKNLDCPSVLMLEKYPFSLSLYEGEDVSSAAKKLLRFCGESKGKQTTFEKLFSDFEKFTPDYVAQQVLEKMKESCE